MTLNENESNENQFPENSEDSCPRIEINGSKVRITSLVIDSSELAQLFQGTAQFINDADSESCIKLSVTHEGLQQTLWSIAQEELKQQVREIHKEGSYGDCTECFLEYYPCPTVQALDAEQR